MANNQYTQLSFGSYKDIPISYEEYYEIIAHMYDDKLSKTGMMRMKNLFEINSYGLIFTGLFCLPPALLLTFALTGKVFRATSGHRFFFPTLSITWPITCWWGFSTPIPRRLYTEILTDPSEDGSYIRRQLKYGKPGLWQVISKRMADKGYLFPEMNEYIRKTEFPTDFVN